MALAITLKVESFAGRKFRDFAKFLSFAKVYTREIVVARPFAKVNTREIFLKMGPREILYPKILGSVVFHKGTHCLVENLLFSESIIHDYANKEFFLVPL